MYQIRKAEMADLPRILEIYAYAREFMASTGNPNQWRKTNPPRETLEADIPAGNLFVLEDQGIHGVFAYFTEPDPTYAHIQDGAWLDDSPYGTIHRIAGDGSGGVFGAALDFAIRQNPHVRIDTHEDNKVMQHILQKHGFQRCGIIYLVNGEPRIAFEKV
ncbi:MAG: N-acetyltransferase [Oscillospiraceae bacterium]|nr:N-acetyltransferase [Oscillospiraceae bacterium]